MKNKYRACIKKIRNSGYSYLRDENNITDGLLEIILKEYDKSQQEILLKDLNKDFPSLFRNNMITDEVAKQALESVYN